MFDRHAALNLGSCVASNQPRRRQSNERLLAISNGSTGGGASGQLLKNARGETRTRKTRRSGDFESPASTNSTTRAVHGNVLLRHDFLNAAAIRAPAYSVRWRRAQAGIYGSAVLPCHLLDAAADLLLKRRVPRALQCCHECRQIALLLGNELDTLPLQLDELVQIARDACLISVRRISHRVAQRETRLALLALNGAALRLEALIDRHEPIHLRVRETDAPARDLIEPLAKATLERRATARCAALVGQLASRARARQRALPSWAELRARIEPNDHQQHGAERERD